MCQSATHRTGIENCTLDVLRSMEKAGHQCLPLAKQNSKTRKFTIPGWNDYIKPYADDSKFWYQLWQASSRPNYGEIFINMKICKSNDMILFKVINHSGDTMKCKFPQNSRKKDVK